MSMLLHAFRVLKATGNLITLRWDSPNTPFPARPRIFYSQFCLSQGLFSGP
jgi:hypothetical protein